MNIYYFNINYSCNNHCKFCFSHNTFLGNERNIELSAIKSIIEKYHISVQDRIIINGGEPTLHSELREILDITSQTGAEIVLYSNGRLLKDYSECMYALQKITRVVIPIHGNRIVHDAITQSDGAFSDTELAITQIAKSQYKDKLELKFIVTDPMIKSNFSVLGFLKKHDISDNAVVISGLVKAKIARLFADIIPNETEAGNFIANNVTQILPFVRGIKLIDFPLCKLPISFLSLLDGLKDTAHNIPFTYYFVDEHYPNGRILDYNRLKSEITCNKCVRKKYCTSVLDSCLVLEFDMARKTIVLE